MKGSTGEEGGGHSNCEVIGARGVRREGQHTSTIEPLGTLFIDGRHV